MTGGNRPFRWLAVAATGFAILFVLLAIETCWIVYSKPIAVDFLSYWAAGHLVTVGRAVDSYNIVLHRLVETSMAPIRGLLPFPYPPPFLLFVAPFGLLPYWLAFALWIAITFLLFAGGAGYTAGKKGLPFALSNPGVLANFLIGQNGFLTSAIFLFGTTLLKRDALAGGVVLGLLVIKPQLAVLIPVALLAGREWRAIFGAFLSSSAALLAALALFGTGVFAGFFKILPFYANAMSASKWPWNEIASPFAALRFFGVPQMPALAAHGVVAAIAIGVTWKAWRQRLDHRAAILAAATMLVPPYLLTYDCLFLVVPLLVLAEQKRSPLLVSAIWLLCLLPILSYFHWYPGPNTIPLAAILSLWVLRGSTPAPEVAAAASGPTGTPAAFRPATAPGRRGF